MRLWAFLAAPPRCMDGSRRDFHRGGSEVRSVGRHAVQRLMAADAIVKIEIAREPSVGFGDRVIGVQVALFVLYAAPQPLDEDVVDPAPFAVHADAHASAFEHSGEVVAGELARSEEPR